MLTLRQFLVLAVLAVMATGCHTITNLTPSQQSRNPSGLYPIEMKWDHREQAMRTNSIKPLVMVGEQTFPMDRTPLMKSRWEALVPVPADRDTIYYRFKIDYQLNAFGDPQPNSKMSPEYKMTITK